MFINLVYLVNLVRKKINGKKVQSKRRKLCLHVLNNVLSNIQYCLYTYRIFSCKCAIWEHELFIYLFFKKANYKSRGNFCLRSVRIRSIFFCWLDFCVYFKNYFCFIKDALICIGLPRVFRRSSIRYERISFVMKLIYNVSCSRKIRYYELVRMFNERVKIVSRDSIDIYDQCHDNEYQTRNRLNYDLHDYYQNYFKFISKNIIANWTSACGCASRVVKNVFRFLFYAEICNFDIENLIDLVGSWSLKLWSRD